MAHLEGREKQALQNLKLTQLAALSKVISRKDADPRVRILQYIKNQIQDLDQPLDLSVDLATLNAKIQPRNQIRSSSSLGLDQPGLDQPELDQLGSGQLGLDQLGFGSLELPASIPAATPEGPEATPATPSGSAATPAQHPHGAAGIASTALNEAHLPFLRWAPFLDDQMRMIYVGQDACKYSSRFDAPEGSITLRIERGNYSGGFVTLTYVDRENGNAVRQHAIDDL